MVDLKRLIQVPLRLPKYGYESFIPTQEGAYFLFHGEGSLVSIGITYGGSGSIFMVDVEPLEDENGYYWENQIWKPSNDDLIKLCGKEPELPPGVGYPIYSSTPPQVGFYSLNAGIKHGLVYVVYGGEHRNIPCAGCYYSPAKKK